MKTLLAFVVAAATLTFGAPVTPISGTAVAGGPLPSTYCGVNFCPPKQQQKQIGQQQKQIPSATFGKGR